MINVSMDGVKDAVETLKELISPWRRATAERRINLELALQRAEIQRVNAETLISASKIRREQAMTEKDKGEAKLLFSQAKKTEAEAALILAQTQKVISEVEKEQAALKQEQIKMIIGIVDNYASKLSEAQKMEYVLKMLPMVEKLTSSKLELT